MHVTAGAAEKLGDAARAILVRPRRVLGTGPGLRLVSVGSHGRSAGVPQAVGDTVDRMNTFSLNTSLMRKMWIIHSAAGLIDRGDLPRGKHLRSFIRMIDAEAELSHRNASSNGNAAKAVLNDLFSRAKSLRRSRARRLCRRLRPTVLDGRRRDVPVGQGAIRHASRAPAAKGLRRTTFTQRGRLAA